MKFDFQFLLSLILIGVLVKQITRVGWFAIGLFVFSWIMLSWKKNPGTMAGVVFTFIFMVGWILFQRSEEKKLAAEEGG